MILIIRWFSLLLILLISRIFLIRESRENKKVVKISGFTVYELSILD